MTENQRASQPQILLVDDDADLRSDLASFLTSRGCFVQTCANGEDALEFADRREFDVAILDLAMPVMSGIEVLRRLEARGAELEAVVLTGHGSIESAVEAMKLGASEFLTKPVSLQEVDRVVRKALEKSRLQRVNRHLAAALKQQRRPQRIIGESVGMQEVYRLIGRTGPSNKPVLIQGDSGTGKELVAHAIHEASPYVDQPFVVVNCAALPETLLESDSSSKSWKMR
jgi:DNA-binding NtrC family response regulator